MDSSVNAGQWQQLKGKIKEAYGKLTDDDIALFNGKKDQFFGKLKEHYGLEKDAAEAKIAKMQSDSASKAASTDRAA
jgi:uncharacterized protein YjbJ (UPF0337 family)